MIARVTTGGAWPCQEGVAPKGAVLLISPQGDADVLGLRFRAAGGDWGGLHVLRDVKDGTEARPFDLEKDLAGLTALIEGIKDLRLIAIDAVQVPGGRGAAAARKTEALFEQLAALARRHKVAVLAVARQAGGDYLSRKPISFGTLPLTAAATAFVVEIDPNDGAGWRERALRRSGHARLQHRAPGKCGRRQLRSPKADRQPARVHRAQRARLQLRQGGGDRVSARAIWQGHASESD